MRNHFVIGGALVACMACAATSPAQAAGPVVINVKTTTPTPLPPGFSGLNTPQMRNGVEYWDQGLINATIPLNPGWVRYPAGTASMDFDWTTGHVNATWENQLIGGSSPLVDSGTAAILTSAQMLTQAKGGVNLSDHATFAQTLATQLGHNVSTIICFNGFTDTNPSSAANMATTAQQLGLSVLEWELSNEPYIYPSIFATPAAYAAAMQNPYYNNILTASPSATIGLFYQGLFSGARTSAWDKGMAAVSPRYWNAVSTHAYPIVNRAAASADIMVLNGILAHGSSEYIKTYLVPKVGAKTPIFITEFNCCKQQNDQFLTYIYNGIFLAEYTARMSTVPNVKGVGVNSLYTDNYDNHGLVQSVNDYESYLFAQLAANPNYSTDTATNPNTQFQFYTSAPGLAMTVANEALNGGTDLWTTTVTGGPTVPITGYDGKPVPAIFAQGYKGTLGVHYLLITNKGARSEKVRIKLDGKLVAGSVSLKYVSSTTPGAANTATSQNNVQIQKALSTNPITVGPYSVTLATW